MEFCQQGRPRNARSASSTRACRLSKRSASKTTPRYLRDDEIVRCFSVKRAGPEFFCAVTDAGSGHGENFNMAKVDLTGEFDLAPDQTRVRLSSKLMRLNRAQHRDIARRCLYCLAAVGVAFCPTAAEWTTDRQPRPGPIARLSALTEDGNITIESNAQNTCVLCCANCQLTLLGIVVGPRPFQAVDGSFRWGVLPNKFIVATIDCVGDMDRFGQNAPPCRVCLHKP